MYWFPHDTAETDRLKQRDHSDLSISNVPAATWYSWNRWVKARRRYTYTTLPLLESYHPLGPLVLPSFTSVQTMCANWLANAGHTHWTTACCIWNRLKLMLWTISTIQPWWHTICVRSDSDSPPLPYYVQNGSCISAFRQNKCGLVPMSQIPSLLCDQISMLGSKSLCLVLSMNQSKPLKAYLKQGLLLLFIFCFMKGGRGGGGGGAIQLFSE